MSALARELHGGPGDPGGQTTPEDTVDDDPADETETWSDYADERR